MSPSSFLWLTIAVLFFSLVASQSIVKDKDQYQIVAPEGVVATDHGNCSKVGVDVLKEGGNAVDAAVAAAFCLGVVSPASSGLGGGAFMLIRLANGTTQAFDMREVAPLNSSAHMYNGNADLKKSGIHSVAVPGELKGLHQAWQQYGSRNISWERLVKPAEDFARNGFEVSPYLEFQLKLSKEHILADMGLRRIFTKNGAILKRNDICKNEKLSETLGLIAKHELTTFYNRDGAVANNLINDIQRAGGRMTLADLENYQVRMREPITSKFLDLDIIGMPPPSSGSATMMLMLNILSNYGNSGSNLNLSLSEPNGTHRKVEALKYGFAARMNLGDPDFDDNVKNVSSKMLNPRIAKILQQNISDDTTFSADHYHEKWNEIEEHGTSHMSIVDKDRNAVSLTTTINAFFGSKILSPSTGIVLNNQMDDFSMPGNDTRSNLKPAPVNFIYPGKRPLSSMNPAIILKNGKLNAVLGASGGAQIIPATTEVFLNHFVHGKSPLDAVIEPRFYFSNNIVYYENLMSVINDTFQLSPEVRKSLEDKHQTLRTNDSAIICQFIVHDLESINGNQGVGKLTGVSDPRKVGFPAGY
ncbi:Gamma-glutamyltranspeptidase [Melia azedarach]|uniref:Gamma-glutamyltranspeptidase n=1 Tax=Melia azedarach TaxID=155640 RepID=A0ACC1XVT0_MELAZ|nr:Gamma-glutamyltranspeptidase [Melia azedarach]